MYAAENKYNERSKLILRKTRVKFPGFFSGGLAESPVEAPDHDASTPKPPEKIVGLEEGKGSTGGPHRRNLILIEYEMDTKARLQISKELGHERLKITYAYLGS